VFVYVLAAIPFVVVGLVIVIAIVTGSAPTGPQALPFPSPAPVGP